MKQNVIFRSPVKSLTSSIHVERTLIWLQSVWGCKPHSKRLRWWSGYRSLALSNQEQWWRQCKGAKNQASRRSSNTLNQVTSRVVSNISVIFCSLTVKPELKLYNANFWLIYVYTQNLLILNTDVFSEQKFILAKLVGKHLFYMISSYFNWDFLLSASCAAHFDVLE